MLSDLRETLSDERAFLGPTNLVILDPQYVPRNSVDELFRANKSAEEAIYIGLPFNRFLIFLGTQR